MAERIAGRCHDTLDAAKPHRPHLSPAILAELSPLKGLIEAAQKADQFLNHSENHRGLVSDKWDTAAVRYERLTIVRTELRATLAALLEDQ